MDKLQKYNDLLVEKNKVVNITAHKTKEDSWHKNIEDSLLFSKEFAELGKVKVLDIGSGAGLPGMPLAIQHENLDITMIDSVNKKVQFINEAISELGIKNARAIHTRIEDLKIFDFDIVISKAVASLPILIEYALPFLKIGGRLLAFKGQNYMEEIALSKKALSLLNCEVERTESKILDEEITRYLVVIKKLRATDKKYPRKKNLPRTSPLV